MNKKRLSVVMAGAMLATSVAPVLAAEVTKDETTHGKIGLFINDLEDLMNTKKYHETDVEAGKSVYRFQVLDADGKEVKKVGSETATEYVTDKTANTKINVFSNVEVLKNLDDSKVYTIKVYELGSVEGKGGLFSTKKGESKDVNYDKTTFAALVKDVKLFSANSDYNDITNTNLKAAVQKGWIVNLEVNKDETKVIITLGSKDDNGEFNKVECAIGTPKLVFKTPVDKDGNDISALDDSVIQGKIAGFKAEENKTDVDKNVSIAGEKSVLLHEVKLLNSDVNYTVKVDDLYDGFMLTDQGHELMNAIKTFENDGNSKTTQSVGSVTPGKGTERYFEVKLKDANGTKTIIKVVGDSLHEGRIKTLKTWLAKRVASVEKLAGSNRYATAVEIAETYIAGQYNKNKANELVLINGKALVDGLAAAPYSKAKEAPILLTATDKLPKETKDFMRKLIAKHEVGELKDITVTIIGGEAVVSQNVANELKEIGFKVKRISGDNREETSLAVADKLGITDKAYVVGAEGEADAMSIAAHAASKKSAIVVAKSTKGLSTVGINEVSDFNKVEIVGGEGVVPKSTEDELVELMDKENVTRINGKNRFETNALVIKKYHKNFGNALIAKDGQRNKEELVDALTASLFASERGGVAAPIVLATDKITDEQLNQLVINSNKRLTDRTVYQIGEGVAEKVMQTVVTKLGLNK